ncbi:hypothetical protein HDV62DRAFT_389991 [Trichoderma sp. SZMC 28011]
MGHALSQDAAEDLVSDDEHEGIISVQATLLPSGGKAAYRIRNSKAAPYQLSTMSDHRKGDIMIRCKILDIVHGTFSPDKGSSFTTLLVFKCSFYSRRHSSRAASVDIELVFKGLGPNDPDPEVIKIVPEGKHCLMPEIQHEILSRGFTSGVNTSVVGGVGGVASLAWQKVTVREKKKYTTLIGAPGLYGRDKGEDDGAAWTLLENPIAKDGVPESFQGAILLKRRDATSHFQCNLSITAKTDRWTTFSNLFESKPLDDPILFNPQMPSTNNMRTYATDRLGEIQLEEFEVINMMKFKATAKDG